MNNNQLHSLTDGHVVINNNAPANSNNRYVQGNGSYANNSTLAVNMPTRVQPLCGPDAVNGPYAPNRPAQSGCGCSKAQGNQQNHMPTVQPYRSTSMPQSSVQPNMPPRPLQVAAKAMQAANPLNNTVAIRS